MSNKSNVIFSKAIDKCIGRKIKAIYSNHENYWAKSHPYRSMV